MPNLPDSSALNPFHPGAGHMPTYFVGRDREKKKFQKLLTQDRIFENFVLTGRRGLGKTVLLETLKPIAIESGWLWAGTDLSESSSISEDHLALRLLADIAVVTSAVLAGRRCRTSIGLAGTHEIREFHLDFQTLNSIYDETPGLVSDKLKNVLETIWKCLSETGKRGMVFAYDEAQNLEDHKARDQFPLSLLLDVFQSIQRKGIPFMLAFTGLPTILPKLVAARTFAERMFTAVSLNPLSEEEVTLAISRPTEGLRIRFSPEAMKSIWHISRGYPHFVQFICRETYDVWLQALDDGTEPGFIPMREILRKLDTDFFAGKWANAPSRQRELMEIIAELPNCEDEFSLQEIVEHYENQDREKPFSSSHANQLLSALTSAGFTFKNSHGKYSFAVPLLGGFIKRQNLNYVRAT